MMNHYRFLCTLLLIGVALFPANRLFGQSQGLPAPESGVILWLEDPADALHIHRSISATEQEAPAPPEHLGFGLYFYQIGALALPRLRAHPGVRYAGPNRSASLRNNRPNDPEYGFQWHH
jgi:hypothetical protein